MGISMKGQKVKFEIVDEDGVAHDLTGSVEGFNLTPGNNMLEVDLRSPSKIGIAVGKAAAQGFAAGLNNATANISFSAGRRGGKTATMNFLRGFANIAMENARDLRPVMPYGSVDLWDCEPRP